MPRWITALILIASLTPNQEPRTRSGNQQNPNLEPRTGNREPGRAGIDTRRLDLLAPLVDADIKAKRLPGVVVLVGHGEKVVYQKAFGNRALVPASEPMTTDTIFDVASLTKVVATTTSVMILVEEGKIRLSDRVASFIPGFERYGKENITVRHLLTHMSGLR